MSPETVAIIGILVLMILLAAKMWIGLAMALVGFFGIAYIRGFDIAFKLLETVPFSNVNHYTLSVLPMFVLMGMVIASTNMAGDMYESVNKWIGHFRGGLALATVVASGFMGAVTGAHSTGLIIMSKVAMPQMKKHGYSDVLSSGSIAAAGPLAILIPPSIIFVLYGIMTEQPVGKLFMAGIIPALLQILMYLIVIYAVCRKNPHYGPPGPKTKIMDKIISTRKILPIFALFLLVMGGIYGGIFTPTEAGAIGAFGSIVIAMISRQITFKGFVDNVMETASMTGMVLLMITGTFIFINFMGISRFPQLVVNLVTGVEAPTVIILLMIVMMYLVLGAFLPEIPMIILTVPFMYPVILALGVDPIWFGVIIVIVATIGCVTPPIGMGVFLQSGVTGVPVNIIYRGVAPFLIGDAVVITLLLLFPKIATYLPNLM